jgi:hypothetical protein
MNAESLFVCRVFPEPIARFELPLPLSIGRLATSNLRLIDDDVSRLHATIELRDEGLVIADQGSRNGIYLQGRRVGVVPIAPGAVLRLGQTILWLGPHNTFRDSCASRIEAEGRSAAPLLLIGEPGVGRRTIARQIHRGSGRSGPLLVSDGAPDEALLRAASGGSIVTEAISAIEKLAPAAATHNVRLFGIGREAHKTSLSVFAVPPLRSRLDELGDALRGYLSADRRGGDGSSSSGVSTAMWNADFFEALACHAFSLNFGELDVICRELMTKRVKPSDVFGIEHLPHAVRAQVVEARSALSEDLSHERLKDVLTRHRGNVRRVAQELGVQRGQLYRVLARFGLNPDLFRGLVSPVVSPIEPVGEERRTQT